MPVLLPTLAGRLGTPTDVGLVMGALNLGGLAGPLAGTLVDRVGAHRLLMATAGAILAIGTGIIGHFGSTLAWMALAFLMGAGTAVAATVANLLVVEQHPRDQWPSRVSSLQGSYGLGQVAGLLVAAALGSARLALGLRVAAGVSAAGSIVSAVTIRTSSRQPVPHVPAMHPTRHCGFPATSLPAPAHPALMEGLAWLRDAWRSRFGSYLVAWFLSYAGVAGVFSLYPVLMDRAFAVPLWRSSAVFAAAAALGLLLYSPAGRWSERMGAGRVLDWGLRLRLAAALALWLLALTPLPGAGWLALLAFAVMVLAWSLLSVSATVMTAELARIGEGPAMGLFNAATALGAVAGSVAAGLAAGRWGYASVPALAAMGIGLGLALREDSERREASQAAEKGQS